MFKGMNIIGLLQIKIFNSCNVLRLMQAQNFGKKTHVNESKCSKENRDELVAQETRQQKFVGRMFP